MTKFGQRLGQTQNLAHMGKILGMGSLCAPFVTKRNLTSQNGRYQFIHYLVSCFFRGDGGEEWRLGFLSYEQMDEWSTAIIQGKETHSQGSHGETQNKTCC
eukprot:sb/3478547/